MASIDIDAPATAHVNFEHESLYTGWYLDPCNSDQKTYLHILHAPARPGSDLKKFLILSTLDATERNMSKMYHYPLTSIHMDPTQSNISKTTNPSSIQLMFTSRSTQDPDLDTVISMSIDRVKIDTKELPAELNQKDTTAYEFSRRAQPVCACKKRTNRFFCCVCERSSVIIFSVTQDKDNDDNLSSSPVRLLCIDDIAFVKITMDVDLMRV